jgi:hypothetical protein
MVLSERFVSLDFQFEIMVSPERFVLDEGFVSTEFVQLIFS